MQGLVVAVWVLGSALFKYILRKSFSAISIMGLGNREDEPIISSTDMLTSRGLQSMAAGMMGNYAYNLLTNSSGKVMMLITLDHNTFMHLIAIGGKSGMSRSVNYALSRKWLEPVSLEGNFPDDFRMYCTKDMQMETRQVFAPDTMAHFQDFCRAYNFELFHDTIYISMAQGAQDPNDDTTMVTDITHFIEQNRRVLDRL
ncbi:MAG: hypothetical protein JWP13_167 [Candidatus Saccharibacteria bacterium]|nr:hypothetical protein [Candidatus Saccharibacteria bacterium]